jgi:multicomponent K+:H+ antiporter subunit E
MTKRIFPFPVLSAILFLSWLLLVAEISVAQSLLALVLSFGIPKLIAPFLDHLPRIRSGTAAIKLIFLVTWDIVIANVAVARLVLGPAARLRPKFIELPIELTNPQSIVLLASIITMTPGTVSSDLSENGRVLIVHALDCADEAKLIKDIKDRYERPLKEIFGC